MSSHDSDAEEAVNTRNQEKTEEKVEEPPLYRVLLHNDDFTPMEFVVTVLAEVFQYSYEDAFLVMFRVHLQGVGLVGLYPYEIAETKVMKATRVAREQGYPLLLTLEEDASQG